MPIVIDGLYNIGRNVKHFELNDCEVTLNLVVEIIETMVQLTSVDLFYIKVSGDVEEAENLPECKFLTHLKLVESDSLFKVFHRAVNLHEICFQADIQKKLELSLFEDILRHQKKLKSLELINIRFSNLFDSNFDFPFQLKSLTIHNCHFRDKENIEKFLERQTQLEDVDMTVSNMKLQLDRNRYFEESLSIIAKRKHLKHLALDIENYDFANMNFLHHCINDCVENLTLSLEQTSCPLTSILKTFPNLQSLALSVKVIDDETVVYINEKLSKLKKIKITKFPSEFFAKLKLKNLKSLHVNEANIELEHWMKFIDSNLNITELIINFTFFMDLSEDFIDIVTRKLKLEHLELIDKWIGMKNDIYFMICENSKSLKYLKLHNINVEQNFDESDKEFLRSRGLRFHLFNDESLNTPMVPF